MRAAALVASAAAGNEAIYGVNTGFGKLASVRIKPADTEQLQRNLILSHCCGVGEPVDGGIVRLMMALKLLSVGRGASGIRRGTIEILEAMLREGVTPVVPAQGSVGASGDLAPLAHMAATMIGEGEAYYRGNRMHSAAALKQAGLAPVILGPKEGLGLINGTQYSTRACARWVFPRHAQPRSSSGIVLPVYRCDHGFHFTIGSRPFTHCAAIMAKSMLPARCERSWMDPRFAKAIDKATRVCKTHTAFAASHKSPVPHWIFCDSLARR